MTKILTDQVRTIVEKSVVDQVLDLPLESVFRLIPPPRKPGSSVVDAMLLTVVHRTGCDGWIPSRIIPGQKPSATYVDNRRIEEWLKNCIAQGATVEVLAEGRP